MWAGCQFYDAIFPKHSTRCPSIQSNAPSLHIRRFRDPMGNYAIGDSLTDERESVSYTHLTLPTNREV